MSYIINKAKYLQVYSSLFSYDEIENVKRKVNSSKSLNRFIDICYENGVLPSADIFVKQLCQSREFLFVFNYNKISVGLIFLLDMWIEKVNDRLKIASDWEMGEKLNDVLKNASKLASGK